MRCDITIEMARSISYILTVVFPAFGKVELSGTVLFLHNRPVGVHPAIRSGVD